MNNELSHFWLIMG